MFMSRAPWIVAVPIALLLAASPTRACIFCSGNPQTAVTVRIAAAQARVVLCGTMFNPRLNPPEVGVPGSGTTQFRIERILKNDPVLGSRQTIEVPRYVPVDPKAPPRFILFCGVAGNKLDAYRGMPVNSAATIDYVRGTLALDQRDVVRSLLFFFRYLDHGDSELANDAFIEFAKANDQQIGAVSGKLAPDKIRKLLLDRKTPPERLGLYAFLLGACGGPRDATLLRAVLDRPTENFSKAYDGLLSGYIQLQPRAGWDLAVNILANERKPFPDRFAVLRTLRFYHAWKPTETQREVLRGLAVTLDQGDIADMAIEDLRRWQLWDLTANVLRQYGKPSHSAPILRRAIVRYALSCPRPEAAQFMTRLRRVDADLVADVQESLEFEKLK